MTCRAKETKNVIDQLKIKQKCKPENKTKAECQWGNKKKKTNKCGEIKNEKKEKKTEKTVESLC